MRPRAPVHLALATLLALGSTALACGPSTPEGAGPSSGGAATSSAETGSTTAGGGGSGGSSATAGMGGSPTSAGGGGSVMPPGPIDAVIAAMPPDPAADAWTKHGYIN